MLSISHDFTEKNIVMSYVNHCSEEVPVAVYHHKRGNIFFFDDPCIFYYRQRCWVVGSKLTNNTVTGMLIIMSSGLLC